MKQETLYTEKQPIVRYQKVSENKADVIVNKLIKEEQVIIEPEKNLKQTMYVYMTNVFSVNPFTVTEEDIQTKIDFYIDYEEEKEKTMQEKVLSLEQANQELATTVDSILTEVIPSLMGVGRKRKDNARKSFVVGTGKPRIGNNS